MVTTSRAENLNTFAEVIQVINSSLEIDEVLRFVMDSIIRLTNAERGFLMLRDGHGELVTQIARNWEQESVHESEYAISRTIINKVVTEGEPIITLNAQEDPRFGGQESIIMFSLRSILCVPLKVKGELIGVLYTDNRVQSGIFSDEDKDLLVAFGNQAAVALENARLFDHAQRNLRRTQALREIDQTITGSLDMQKVLQDVVDQIMCELGLDAAAVLLFDTKEQILKYEIGYGLRTEALRHTNLHLGEGYAGKAALGMHRIFIPDLTTRTTDFLRSPTFHEEGFICYFGVPLIAKGEIKGVLELFHRSPLEPEQEWLDYMEILAGQMAIAVDNATLFRDLQQSNNELISAYDSTIQGWSRALDLRDRETEGHTQRVTGMTLHLARQMGIRGTELGQIRRGALLHDIGKMGISDQILLKPSKLTDEEWQIIRRHPEIAVKLLSPISYLKDALDIPSCHHEKWDGSGYPRGLQGDEIPLAARIFAVCDVYDALTSDRPYRKAWTRESAIGYILEQAGTHFDPDVVKVFSKVIGIGISG